MTIFVKYIFISILAIPLTCDTLTIFVKQASDKIIVLYSVQREKAPRTDKSGSPTHHPTIGEPVLWAWWRWGMRKTGAFSRCFYSMESSISANLLSSIPVTSGWNLAGCLKSLVICFCVSALLNKLKIFMK